jgi:prevent-host-death family protein
MKRVSIQELKRDLSSIVESARQGAGVLITRHNRPVARLSSAEGQYLHIGSRFGKARLRPVLRGKTSGRYLEILEEDRRAGRAER